MDVEYIVQGLLLAAVFCYFGAPIYVMRQFRKPIEPPLYEVPLLSDRTPVEAVEILQETNASLEPLGFELVKQAKAEAANDAFEGYLHFFVSNDGAHLAMALYAGHPTRVRQVEFHTEFQDGLVINTNNSTVYSYFPRASRKKVFAYPELKDAGELFKAHCALCARYASGQLPTLFLPDTIIPTARQGMKEDFEHAVSIGLFYRDDWAGAYRLTFRGAYILSWRQMPPMKRYFAAKARRADRRELEEAMLGRRAA